MLYTYENSVLQQQQGSTTTITTTMVFRPVSGYHPHSQPPNLEIHYFMSQQNNLPIISGVDKTPPPKPRGEGGGGSKHPEYCVLWVLPYWIAFSQQYTGFLLRDPGVTVTNNYRVQFNMVHPVVLYQYIIIKVRQ